jgi:hypothetical protein
LSAGGRSGPARWPWPRRTTARRGRPARHFQSLHATALGAPSTFPERHVARPGAGEAGPTDRREMRRADRAPALVPPPGPGRVVGGDSARAGARDVDAVWGCDRASSIGPLGTGQRRGFARAVKSSSWGAPVQGHRGPSGLKSTKVSRLRSLSGRPNPPVVDAAAAIRGAAIAAAGALGARHGGWVVWQFGPTKYANYRRFQIWPMAGPQNLARGKRADLARGRHPSVLRLCSTRPLTLEKSPVQYFFLRVPHA